MDNETIDDLADIELTDGMLIDLLLGLVEADLPIDDAVLLDLEDWIDELRELGLEGVNQ